MPDPTTLQQLAPWLRFRVASLRSAAATRTRREQVEVVSPAIDGDVDERATGGVVRAAWPCPSGGPDGREPLGTPAVLDRGLRVDLLCALMPAVPEPCAVVVSRAEHHDTCSEEDLAWTGAAHAAAGITAADLVAVVMVSRWGWLDLLSGQRRDWKRLRIRPT